MVQDLPSKFADVLARLQGVQLAGGRNDKWYAHCPAHDDRRRSLTVMIGHTGNMVISCMAPCRCKASEIMAVLGLGIQHLFLQNAPGYRGGKGSGRMKDPIAVYQYEYEDGTYAYDCCRYEPKDFRFRRLNPKYDPRNRGSDGEQKYIYNLEGTRRVVYRLPRLLKAWKEKSDRIVFLCEGEKDAERAERIGLLATTAPMGARNWLKEFAEVFRGRRVVIPFDQDDYDEKLGGRAGYMHALKVANDLFGVAETVQLLQLPLKSGKDFTDWVDQQDTQAPDGLRARLWGLTRFVSPYYPGWEYASDFERLVRNELYRMRAGKEYFSLNELSQQVDRHMKAFLTGLDLNRVADMAAKQCAAVQYFVESMAGLKGARVDPFEKPVAAMDEESLFREVEAGRG